MAVKDKAEDPEQDFQDEEALRAMEEQIARQEEVDRQREMQRLNRNQSGSMVAARPVEYPGGNEVDRYGMMEEQGVPRYAIESEQKADRLNRKVWEEHLEMGKRMVPQDYRPVDERAMEMSGELISSQQQEFDRIMMARIQLAMENPPRRQDGLTIEEAILSKMDETIPGGVYVVGGRKVDANGREVR